MLFFTAHTTEHELLILLTYCRSGIEGDPVKFGLGLASMVYDVIFMAQHYCLFPAGKKKKGYNAAHPFEEEGGAADWDPDDDVLEGEDLTLAPPQRVIGAGRRAY